MNPPKFQTKSRHYALTMSGLFILLGAVLLAEAGDLTRETALAVMQKGGKEPYEIDIPIGDSVNMDVMFSTLKHMDRSRADQINAAYKCLNDMQYLDIRKNPRDRLGNYMVKGTDKSGKIGKIVNKRVLAYNTAYVFKIADRVPQRVTGIKKADSNTATVLFDWGLGNFNEVFRCMVPAYQPLTKPGQAVLGKYDDGWRVEKVNFYPKN